jgi:hypothetical protein
MMPDDQHIITQEDGSQRIAEKFLKYDPDWQHNISRFQEDIYEGRNDPEWIAQALKASERRMDEQFDSFKEKEFEEFWGQKQKFTDSVIAGEATGTTLDMLFKEGILKVGDVWSFARTIGKKGAGIVTEKEIIVSFQLAYALRSFPRALSILSALLSLFPTHFKYSY